MRGEESKKGKGWTCVELDQNIRVEVGGEYWSTFPLQKREPCVHWVGCDLYHHYHVIQCVGRVN